MPKRPGGANFGVMAARARRECALLGARRAFCKVPGPDQCFRLLRTTHLGNTPRPHRRYVACRPRTIPVANPVPTRITAPPASIAAVTVSPRNHAPHSIANSGTR